MAAASFASVLVVWMFIVLYPFLKPRLSIWKQTSLAILALFAMSVSSDPVMTLEWAVLLGSVFWSTDYSAWLTFLDSCGS
jgi:hypothetical protein